MARVYDPIKYGWGLVHYLTIEAVPVVWDEYATGLALPSGYSTEDATLVLDGSGEIGTVVDREAGLGAGQPLTFSILDSTTSRTWFSRWTAQTYLTADETSIDGTINVADTTDFGATGAIYIGFERISHAGKAPTTFTGCGRGTGGGRAYQHLARGMGSIVTDKPMIWRGRRVKLWAVPVDPVGYIPDGATLSTDAELVWTGYLTDGPRREGSAWKFSALPLERTLDIKLAPGVSGTVTSHAARYPIKTYWSATIHVVGWDPAGAAQVDRKVTFSPFNADLGYSDGDLLTGAEMRAAISDEWGVVVLKAGYDGDLGELGWSWAGTFFAPPAPGSEFEPLIRAFVQILNANCYQFDLSINAGDLSGSWQAGFGTGVSAGWVFTGWLAGDDPTNPMAASWPTSLTVQVDDGEASDVPSTGAIVAEDIVYTYEASAVLGGSVYLSDIKIASVGAAAIPIGTTVELVADDSGKLWQVVLRALESSGETGLRGTYDTLGDFQGYGIESTVIDETGITARLGDGKLGQMALRVARTGSSLADVIGGMLALDAKAIVSKYNPGTFSDIRLSAVHTGPSGSDYVATITDAELVLGGGSPVTIVTSWPTVNRVIVRGMIGDEETTRVVLTDRGAAAQQGIRSVSYDVPVAAADHDTLYDASKHLAAARFGLDQTGQAIVLRVVPWLGVETGDTVSLSLTHSGIWTYSTGLPGYVGLGRVIGRTYEIDTGIVSLTVLIDGYVTSRGLCPAALVSAWGGAAGAATTIDVPIEHYDHFAMALSESAGATFDVLHYQPGTAGAEGTTWTYTIRGVAIVGGACQLDVSSQGGVHSLDTALRSTLTLPETASADAYQAGYMHDADGSIWGV